MNKSSIFAGALLALVSTTAFATDKHPATTKQLNQQQLRAVQKANASAKAGAKSNATGGTATGGSASTGGDNIDGSLGFSYARNPTTVPQAVIGDQIAITSSAYEFGPLFSMATQDTEYLPAGMTNLSDFVTVASRNDGTPQGRSRQADALAVLCFKAEGLANIRYGEGACGRIRKVVDEGTIVSDEQ